MSTDIHKLGVMGEGSCVNIRACAHSGMAMHQRYHIHRAGGKRINICHMWQRGKYRIIQIMTKTIVQIYLMCDMYLDVMITVVNFINLQIILPDIWNWRT